MSCDEGTFLKTAAREAFLLNLWICALDARRVTSQDGGSGALLSAQMIANTDGQCKILYLSCFVLVLY